MKRLQRSVLALALAGLMSSAWADQELANKLSQFTLNYAVQDNHAQQHGVDCAALGADWAACSKAVITLTNHGDALADRNWTIWFHSIRQILKVDNEQFKVTHVMGDLHKLEPTDKFTGFPANQSITIPIINEYWQLFITDVLPRWYVTSDDSRPVIIANTDTEELARFVSPLGEQWKRTPDDKNVLMTAEARYNKNSDVALPDAAALRGQIVPTPKTVTVHAENVDLSRGVTLDLASLAPASREAVASRFAQLGVKTSQGYPVKTLVAPGEFQKPEAVSGAYRLQIKAQETRVTGYDAAGVFYGLQSLLSLLPAQGEPQIATLEVSDAPRFSWRAIHLDVGRNFHSKAAVLRLLDQMAAYKLNKFHFHLSDDEGWRLEIPGLPELTETGAKRCHDLSEKRCLLPQLGSGPESNNNGSGYFTRADYIEIVKYAAARHIEVIPEIDMPAHARAAVVSMEARYARLMEAGKAQEANHYRLLDPADTSNTTGVQYYDRTGYLNPCLASSRNFVDKVISEVQLMHKEAGQPLTVWHAGGDEAKNIYLGTGYTDKSHPEEGKGIIDLSKQNKPWEKSPACKKLLERGEVADVEHLSSYFGIEISKLVNAHGIGVMQAWQDGLKDAKDASAFSTRQVSVNFWDTLFWGGFDTANDWANKGFRVIVSNPDYLYLDFPYEVNPAESGYYWGTRFSDERKIFSFAPDNLPQNAETSVDRDGNTFSAKSDKPWPGALGLSAQLWSEVVRTDKQMEYMIYPRLIVVAERAWHRAAWEQAYQAGREYKGQETQWVDKKALASDWARFASLIGHRELAKLDKAGIQYRLPVPGARVEKGILEINTSLPGLGAEYSTDNGKSWLRYDNNARPQVEGEVQIRAVSPDGQRYSRVDSVK
ncbi:beta-N-acetylhexosaminidase [Franconibacter pulveris]|uniref:beta-N-acetylhexosaminidase n=1 Tax=Franconibacter pulveris TaxID=435910 RepID=UPI0004962BCE|nr:beta-N-acetylhexosaminidase [Franconibacter pulveris]